jgi:dTDP-4-amino-4,6-dideoxygalactose transaminase
MKQIYVTQPYLPNLEEFTLYLENIWDNKILTNVGPYHQQLEKELCNYLGVKYISLFTNGTIALVTALQCLKISGEVITSPYSFVATAHSLLWNGLKPVFVDIESDTFNINSSLIEKAITENTTAIMPVHCYGNPCDVELINKIADKYNLKVIYDAAHAFGVKDNNGSILNYGDLSILSFHATKVFNTFEGGAIICKDQNTKDRIDQLKNFGFVDEITVVEAGINGKMSEINAAFGLLNLKYVDEALSKRKIIDEFYRSKINSKKGIKLFEYKNNYTMNYSYFPILVEDEYHMTRDELYLKFKQKGIYTRRYFYPLISNFPMYNGFESSDKSNLAIANNISNKVLCLPIYPSLNKNDLETICNII